MEIDSEILEAMETDVKVKRVDAIESVTKDIKYSQEKTVHVGLGNTVFECVKKLANKTNVSMFQICILYRIFRNSYTLIRPPVQNNSRALASGVSPVKATRPWYNYLYLAHQRRPCSLHRRRKVLNIGGAKV